MAHQRVSEIGFIGKYLFRRFVAAATAQRKNDFEGRWADFCCKRAAQNGCWGGGGHSKS
jgi:hypothetical protein